MELLFKSAFKEIQKANNILLITHAKPDGDAVASICSIMLVLEGMNKKYYAYSHDPAPQQYLFLQLSEKISKERNFNFSDFDLIITLDCGSLSRTMLSKEIKHRNKNQKLIEIDHHIKIEDYSDIELRIPMAASTTEVIYEFLKANQIKINTKIAECILTGILTDTGNFLYPSTTDKTVRIASEMMLFGARFPQILEEIQRNKSISTMKLWGKVISNLKINQKYKIAYTILSLNDLKECENAEEKLEGIAGFMSGLQGINGLMVLRQAENGGIKGSLRAGKNNINISKLANILGGGGHKKSAGFFLDAKLEKKNGKWQVS